MFKYTKIYSGRLPELKEDDIFRAYIPLIGNIDDKKEIINERNINILKEKGTKKNKI